MYVNQKSYLHTLSDTWVDAVIVVTQVFSLSKNDELRREEVCADAVGRDGEAVVMRHCHGHRGNQQWKHDRVTTSPTVM